MKKTLLLFSYLLICYISNSQVNIEYINNLCPEPDVLTVCVEDHPFAGKYKYETVHQFCSQSPITSVGESDMTVNARGHYFVRDFSFGAWNACFGDTIGTIGTVEMRATCSLIEGVVGTDRFGNIWSSDGFSFEDNSFSYNWFNTYGDFGRTTLTPIDGRVLNDPTTVLEDNYSILWSTGETSHSIETIETGDFSVTVTDPSGDFVVAEIRIEEDPSTLEEECGGQIIDISYFLDSNENGTQDNGEMMLFPGDEYVNLIPQENIHGIVNNQFDRFVVDPNTYSFEFVNENYRPTNLPSEFTITKNSGTSYFNIGINPISIIHSVDVALTATAIERCDNIIPYKLRIQNDGTTAYSGDVSLSFDPLIKFVSAEKTPSGQSETSLTWNVNITRPTDFVEIIIYFLLPSSDYVGDILCITPNVDVFNKAFNAHCFELRCSHDPNDKHGLPHRGGENKLAYDETIEYTIRFENLGNDTAFNIKITDEIEENFDLRSFQMLQSSHSISMHWIDRNNTLNVKFGDIQLPSIAQDSIANKGFFQFRIKPKEDLPELTKLKNKASIFFDSNAAIVTNTTSHQLVSNLTSTHIKNDDINFSIFPNPTSDLLNISIYEPNANTFKISVLDINGKRVVFDSQNTVINLDRFETGVYYLEVKNKSGNKSIQKFVKL
ncbi:MAG: T9SS type A sorting domain-containing protein [Saprospiraceae bacterium]|nr:T9SS type A sorting domain-containing protein [Saprospiraceae bacterium]